MKKLPCKTCGKVALARREPELYQTAGRISSSKIKYLCKRCGHMQDLTASEFTRLPRMTEDEVRASTCDVVKTQ